MNLKTANRLCELRKEKNLSQEELAAKIGVSRQTISKWERSEASPDTDNLIALAKLYNMSLDDLLSVENVKEEDLAKEENVDEELKTKLTEVGELIEKKLDSDDDDDDDDEGPHKRRWHDGWLNAVLLFSTIIGFFLLGFIGHYWRWCWLIFLLWVCVESLISAIEDKNPEDFAFPVLAALVFLFVGLYFGLWHPTWLVFLLIPPYYAIASSIRHRVKRNK